MSDILDIWHAHLANVVASAAGSAHEERELARLAQDAESARLRRQTEEGLTRAEFLQMTREELAEFRAWLRQRGEGWRREVE